MTESIETQATQTPQETGAEKPNYDLTVNDLNGLRAIVDVATQRGAFKASELEAVGKIYNKLNGFLESVTASSTPAAETEKAQA